MSRVLILICCIILGTACHSGSPPYVVTDKIIYVSEDYTRIYVKANIQAVLPSADGFQSTGFNVPVEFDYPLVKQRFPQHFGVKTAFYEVSTDKITIHAYRDKANFGKDGTYIITFDWEGMTADINAVQHRATWGHPSGTYEIKLIKNDSPDYQWFNEKFKKYRNSKEYHKNLQDLLHVPTKNNPIKSSAPINDSIRNIYVNNGRCSVDSMSQNKETGSYS